MRKYADIQCNLDFIEIYTLSTCCISCQDPLGDDFYFSLTESFEILGNSLMSALKKSRNLSSTPKEREEALQEMNKNSIGKWHSDYHEKWLKNNPDRSLFELELVEKRWQEWIERVFQNYGYKNKKALFKDMQSCSVAMEDDVIIFSPRDHDKLEGWGLTKKEFSISFDSTPEAIGAAVKYSIAKCTGKGADLITKKLFPDGIPNTLDEYLTVVCKNQ